MSVEAMNPFRIAQARIDEAARLLNLEPSIHAALREPMRELHVTFPVRMDNGEVRLFRGFRVQYNDARGPAKGGVRFHPEETIDTVREAARHLGLDTRMATVAVQGYGNAGSFAAILSRELLGTRVIAVSDSKGGILHRDGLDPRAVLAHKQRTGSVVGFPGARGISNDELLALDVDILWPCALENMITGRNARDLRARILAEAANGPTTPDADDILRDKGVFVIPDFLCNAGGVTVSYFEWAQNLGGWAWEEQEIERQLDLRMTRAFREVLEAAQARGIDTRRAAHVVAVSRVAEAMRLRGWA